LAAALGACAWGLQCLGYALAIKSADESVALHVAFAVPPAAILLGAASMVPGGIGATEVATVYMLSQFGVSLDQAVVCAISMRVGSIWFSTLLGVISIIWLEWRSAKTGAVSKGKSSQQPDMHSVE
ncbi:MAG: flippase-like domain-containing protein, partial [Pseudomonadota bacterium]